MIYISFAECENNYKSQHNTAHDLLTSLLNDLGFSDPVIKKEECGRPFVDKDGVDISISHSNNLVAVGVATAKKADTDNAIIIPIEAKRIGIDIEYIDNNSDLKRKNKLANRFLSRSVSSIEEFYSLWTGNEAVGKMTGEGVLQNASVNCHVTTFTVKLESRSQEYSFSFAIPPQR